MVKVRASRWLGTAMAAVLSCGTVANASLITVIFDAAYQNGGVSANMGFSYIPTDILSLPAPLVLTAGSLTDTTLANSSNPLALTTAVTIYTKGTGAGVQDAIGSGSELVSGLVNTVIEQLVLTFDQPARSAGLVLTLKEYRALSGAPSLRDIPYIFVHLVGGAVNTYNLTHITESVGQTGTLDLGTLLLTTDQVEKIVVRNTKNHFALNSMTFEAIPAPGSVVLLALAGLLAGRGRRSRLA